MKKIVSILAVAAMAASMFAVDVAGKVKITGSLFDYNTNDEKVNVLKLDNGNKGFYPWGQTGISFSASTENAGASIVLTAADDKIFDRASIWAKPADFAKVTVGYQSYGINTETIDWSGITGKDGNGYGVSLSFAPVTIDLAAFTGFDYLIKDGAVANPIYAKVGASGDWGNAAASITYKKDDLYVAAGYSGNAGAVSYFADVAYADADKDSVIADAFANYSDNGITAKVYVKNTYNVTDSKESLGFKVYGGYALSNGMGVSLTVKSADILADNMGLTIKPNLSGSWGACGWNVGVEMIIKGTIGDPAVPCDFQVSVPVDFSVSL